MRKHHGKSKTRLYAIWCGMKARCYNPARNRYQYYGAKGIGVCEEWKNDFLAFEEWAIKSGYADNLTIERINIDKNYTPENCAWVTHEEQAKNKRNNRKILGKNTGEWARRLGGNHKLVSNRISKLGWSETEAISKPKRQAVLILGKKVEEWEKLIGISRFTIWKRLRRGWTGLQAIEIESRNNNKNNKEELCTK